MVFATELSEEDQEFAKQNIGEYATSRDSALTILKDKIALEPGLKANLEDGFLIRFLRVKKYDIDKAMALVKKYYSARNDEFFKNFLPSTIVNPLRECVSCPMVTYNPVDHTRIVVFRPGKWTGATASFQFADMVRCHIMISEYILKDERTQVRGVRFVVDGSDVGFDHLKELTTGLPQKIIKLQQEAMPIRIKGIHYINEPSVMGSIFGLMKPFMKEKLIKRIHFHGTDFNALHEFIDPAALPEQLGGLQPPLPHEDFIKDMLDNEDYFKHLAQFYLDEPKEIFKSDSSDACESGITGTFKKLNLD